MYATRFNLGGDHNARVVLEDGPELAPPGLGVSKRHRARFPPVQSSCGKAILTLGGVKTRSLSADTFSTTRSLSVSQPAESGLSLIVLVLDEEFSFERSFNSISFVTSMLVMMKQSCGSFTNKRYVSNNVKDASVRSKISLFCGVHNVTAVNSVAFISKESTSTVHRKNSIPL